MLNRRRAVQGMAAAAAGVALRARGVPPAGGSQPGPPQPPLAEIAAGRISGSWADASTPQVAAFKGIPYGADTRETRFLPPKKAAPWSGTRPCVDWPARAPQQSATRAPAAPTAAQQAAINRGFDAVMGAEVHYHLPPDEGGQSEDCLHLNLWTPALGRRARKLPVLVYIHGGAYNNGTVNSVLYDGTRLARRGDAVVVTVNHRLNAFGFLYLGGMDGLPESYRASGNAGMLDLVLALEWVRDNIAAFGGDPARVTIFGQSGGGAKCATLMAMPGARGLFHRVWTMSGQQVWGIPPVKARHNAAVALKAMGIEGDPTPEKLNALTVEQIQAGARTTNNWLPVVDGDVLTRDPFQPDAPPISDAIPMVLGNTRDEILGAQAWRQAALIWETLPAVLDKELAAFRGPYSTEDIIAAYRKWYPTMQPVDVYVASVAAFRSWPGQVIEAEKRAASPVAARHTWVYQVNWGSPVADGRAPHTVDIAFVFDNLRLGPGVVGDSDAELAAAQPLATLMSGRLADFARTGIPGSNWPVYAPPRRETMLFNTTSKVVSDPRSEERRMMAGAGYRQPGT